MLAVPCSTGFSAQGTDISPTLQAYDHLNERVPPLHQVSRPTPWKGQECPLKGRKGPEPPTQPPKEKVKRFEASLACAPAGGAWSGVCVQCSWDPQG